MASERTPQHRRWAVIDSDGRHAWLGRRAEPTAAELEAVTASLHGQGLTAWLAVTEGVYYRPGDAFSVRMVHPLAGTGDWEAAKALFLARRAQATAAPPSP